MKLLDEAHESEEKRAEWLEGPAALEERRASSFAPVKLREPLGRAEDGRSSRHGGPQG
ncbi:MAG TPA: hypothetical protein VHZ54_10485 [Solirubrobacterales bacterium]|nr:hypothetical protein [Solirubrobacterales bacterium]